VLEVSPGTGGIFEVHVDGERLWHKKMLGRYPEPENVVPHIAPALGPPVPHR
jgi:selT/selW/selH-like putative selenoprotein